MSHPVRNYLRTAVGEDPSGPADAELLARFATARDETAFELLVWRHASLIQRVCRGVLRDHHDAEDAAQAAFLVLARKAHTFAGHGSVVGWLYRIARRAAVRLAKDRARREVGSGHLEQVPALRSLSSVDRDETEALCAEVDRLPERYRIPILLCFFEGLTHAEASRRTGWAIGTVAGRLARAKALLARRLSHKGVGAAGVALGLPAGGFIGGTVQAAAAFATGRAVVPGVDPSVYHLAQGVMKAMTATYLKLTAAAAACLLCAAGTTLWGLTPSGTQVPAAGSEPVAQLSGGGQPPGAGRPDAAPERMATASQRMISQNKLKQIMLAMHNYLDTNGGILPHDLTDKDGKPRLSWRVALLPYLEQEELYRQFKLDEPWNSEHNKKLLARMPPIYREDFQPRESTKTYFQVFAGPGTVFEPGKKLRLTDITDGTSNTLGPVEAGPPVEWTRPADLAYDPKQPIKLNLPFKNVFNAAMMDGSAHSFRPDLDADFLRKLIGRADGEVIPPLEDRHVKDLLSRADVEHLQRVLKEYEKMSEAITAELREQQKLLRVLAEKMKREEEPRTGPEGVPAEARGQPADLAAVLQTLRRHTEELRKAIDSAKKK